MTTPILIATGSFLIAAAALKAVPALAEPVQPQNVSVVQTADLDLSSEAGRRELNQRFVIAAYEVCGEASDIDLAGIATDYCVRASALDAVAAGRRVRVFTDLIAGVHPESSERALAEIAHAGGVLASSAD